MMTIKARYTLWIEKEGLENDDLVLATGLTVAEAAKFICEYGNAKPYICAHAYGPFRAVELHQYSSEYKLLVTVGATVPMTNDIDADRRLAMEMIDAQVFARHHEFWPGRISTDAEFEARLQRIQQSLSAAPVCRKGGRQRASQRLNWPRDRYWLSAWSALNSKKVGYFR